MPTLYTHQDANVRKTWALMTIFLVVVIGLGWLFSQAWGDPSILYIAVVFAVAMNFFSYWYSDKIVIKMTGARAATDQEFPDFYNTVENLSITAGLPMPKIYVIDDPAPNAFATGRNPDHAALAATTGLLQILDKSELEGVVAHELSHIGNRDMLVSTVAVVLVGFVAILSDIFLRSRLYGFSRGRDRNNRVGGLLVLLAVVAAVLAPIAATLIRLAVSRRREFLADASGALLTRYPEGLASALQKISQSGAALRRASNATAHLYIANPFGGQGGLIKLFMTHPPVEARIAALLGKAI
ncbi:MAG: M48 family metalloprotease [Candidatus Vogelbacteria bacterium]|nr:M48 family metalloprotease [Candidatus Vogelbacteria bacterium]